MLEQYTSTSSADKAPSLEELSEAVEAMKPSSTEPEVFLMWAPTFYKLREQSRNRVGDVSIPATQRMPFMGITVEPVRDHRDLCDYLEQYKGRRIATVDIPDDVMEAARFRRAIDRRHPRPMLNITA